MMKTTVNSRPSFAVKRPASLYQATKYVALLPALALALVMTPAPKAASQDSVAGGLSKRFIRFNEYLFNGVEAGTAIAAAIPSREGQTTAQS